MTTTSDIFVRWYDDYGCPHYSKVYFVDSVRDRFLIVVDQINFRWVSTNDCELVEGENNEGI